MKRFYFSQEGWYSTKTGAFHTVERSGAHHMIALDLYLEDVNPNLPDDYDWLEDNLGVIDDAYAWMYKTGWARISLGGFEVSKDSSIRAMQDFVIEEGAMPDEVIAIDLVVDHAMRGNPHVLVESFLDAGSWMSLAHHLFV